MYFINQDIELYDEETDSQLQCRALNITEDLGQIQYIFSDKTGTLTENKMVFRRCTVSGIEYSHDANGESGDRAPIWAGPESYQSYMPVCLCVRVYTHTHTHSASGIDDFGGRIKQKGRQSSSGPAFTEKPSPQC